MKKISLKTIKDSLSNDELKKIQAGSGGSSCPYTDYSCFSTKASFGPFGKQCC